MYVCLCASVALTLNTLQSYKEEVDTLNEALKIAAMDIAEVAEADDDLLSDEDAYGDEDLDSILTGTSRGGAGAGAGGGAGAGAGAGGGRAGASEVDDEGFSDAAGSKRDKAFNTASMLREARKDYRSGPGGSRAGGGGGGGGSSVGSASTRGGGSVTFVVGQSGTYEQR